MKIKVVIISILLLISLVSNAQDTIRLISRPILQLQRWPDHEVLPKLKIGESNLIYTSIPVFNGLIIRNNDIDLVEKGGLVEVIEDEDKTNLFNIIPRKILRDEPEIKWVEFEVWLFIGKDEVFYPTPKEDGLGIYDKNWELILKNVKWINLREKYKVIGDRILLTTERFSLEK